MPLDSLKNGSSHRAGSVFCIASLSNTRIGDARADIYGLGTISYIEASVRQRQTPSIAGVFFGPIEGNPKFVSMVRSRLK